MICSLKSSVLFQLNIHVYILIAGPREARNPNLDSDQRIAYYACAQVYNRDTETGSWKFVLQLRTIRMRKMCQSQKFVTWDTGCRLLSHARSKYVSSKLFSPEKIKNFRVNSYHIHTSAKVQSIPYQSSFIMLRFQRNGRKPEFQNVITIFFSPRVITWLSEVATVARSHGCP